jgi:hypothetical protein
MTIVRHSIFPDDAASVLSIWREFIANSPVNLDYQGNDAEFATLPGKYAAPHPGGQSTYSQPCVSDRVGSRIFVSTGQHE